MKTSINQPQHSICIAKFDGYNSEFIWDLGVVCCARRQETVLYVQIILEI